MTISVIIPVKNQMDALMGNLAGEGIPFYDSLGCGYEFIIVDDGSNPSEDAKLREGCRYMKSVRILPFSAAKGKGNAVRKGVEAANGDYVMFMDADFATDLSALKTALPLLSERCLVVGSRGNKASKVSQRVSPFRNILSWGSRFLIKAMFGLKGISDTQCGWKIADSKTAKSIAKRQRIPGGAFDVEWLWYCKLNGIPYREIPVLWTDQEGSTITHPVRDAARFFRDIVDVRTHKRLYVESEAK